MKTLFFLLLISIFTPLFSHAVCVKIENGKESPLTGTERDFTIDKSSLGALQKQFKGIADQAFTGDTDTCSDAIACKGKKYITCR